MKGTRVKATDKRTDRACAKSMVSMATVIPVRGDEADLPTRKNNEKAIRWAERQVEGTDNLARVFIRRPDLTGIWASVTLVPTQWRLVDHVFTEQDEQ